jgi:DNA-binding Xre family transcriptional regulator
MSAKHIHRKTERTPEQEATLAATRAWFRTHRPTLEQLLASGEYIGPFTMQEYLQRAHLFAALRQVREQAGLSLQDLADRTGIDKGYLSRLETGGQENTTIETLCRVAAALGKDMQVFFVDHAKA